MDNEQLKQIVEALIFASDTPLTVRQMVSLIEAVSAEQIEQVLQLLNSEYRARPFFLKRVGGGYRFATRPEFSAYVKKLFEQKSRSRLTRAALETLAIVSFKQPISRSQISAIRGVNSDGVVKGLLERNLIGIGGRDTGPGRALLFSTTDDFLYYFGLNEISDLPRPKEIEELLAEGEGANLLREIPQKTEDAGEAPVSAEASNNGQESTSAEKAADAEAERPAGADGG